MANSTTIDEELYDGLQQARKKKPRNFCVVSKGAEVVKMIVQKKKINDGQAQKAKSEAKGTAVVTGVIIGEGNELSLEITGSEPSITPKKIRDYIADQTDLTLKPKWTVVQELRTVEEESGESEGQESPTAKAQVPPQAPPTPPAGQQTSGQVPPQAPPPPPVGQTPPQAPPAPPPPPGDLLAELVAKMNKLSPAIQAAAQANPQLKGDLLQAVSGFQTQVKAKDAAKAQEALKEVAKLLKESTGKPPQAPPPPTGQQSPPPAPQPPVGQTPPQAPPPPPVQQSQEQEQGESESQEQTEAEAKAAAFSKNWAAARKNLRAALDKVEEQLAALAEAMLAQSPDDENAVWIAEEGLSQLLSGLRGSATTIDKSASKSPSKVVAFAKPALAELEKRLDNPQVEVCDKNVYGVKVSIRKTIQNAIDELVQSLEEAGAL